MCAAAGCRVAGRGRRGWNIADRVAMLHDHRIEALGSADEIRASGNPVVRQFIEGRAEGPIEVARDS